MFFKKTNKPQSKIDTLIGVDTKLEGNIVFSGGLRVDGHIRGDITENAMASTLVISEHGSVEGAVNVTHIVINGKVKGPVRAGQFIELQTKGRVTGDVHYKSLEMHTGALIEGRLVYIGEAEPAGDDPLFGQN